MGDSDAAAKLDQAGVGRIFREESGRSVATLIRVFGDIDLAEDAVQEAFAVALRTWPRDGLPPNPGGWITTAARNRALDRLRRESRGRELLSEVAALLPGDHATRADLLRRLGRHSEAEAAYQRAAAMAPTDAERDFLRLGGRAAR